MGTLVKVYTNTLNIERGRFARTCVEIGLTLLVVRKVGVSGHWYNVWYEGFHIICSRCGCYGHHPRDCRKILDNLIQSTVPTVEQPKGMLKNDVIHE